MTLHTELSKAWQVIAQPEEAFAKEHAAENYWTLLRFYLLLNVVLAVLTPLVNWFHIPSNIIHAGTNAQMGAYTIAPFFEGITGISRYFWVGLFTYLGNILKFPLLGLILHALAKILRGTGSLLNSFQVGVYTTAPMLLFGWIPFFGLISGLWTGYLYVIALNRLHDVTFGSTIALINLMIGIQVVWAFVFGWVGSPTPW